MLPFTPVIYIDRQGNLISKVSAEQVEAVLGPHVDHIRSLIDAQAAIEECDRRTAIRNSIGRFKVEHISGGAGRVVEEGRNGFFLVEWFDRTRSWCMYSELEVVWK